MWWNVTGFMAAAVVGAGDAVLPGRKRVPAMAVLDGLETNKLLRYGIMLIAWFAAIIIACAAAERLAVLLVRN